jgi:hypothetical protein
MNKNTAKLATATTAKLPEECLRFNIDAIRAALNSSGSDAERLALIRQIVDASR